MGVNKLIWIINLLTAWDLPTTDKDQKRVNRELKEPPNNIEENVT